MKGRCRTGSALAAAFAAIASLSTPTLAQSARQAAYDSAQAALDREDWTTAATGFAALLPVDAGKRLSRSEGVMATRLGAALIHLQRRDEARTWIARGIAALPTNDPLLPDAWLFAGEAARFDYDYPEAIASYDKAIALGGGSTTMKPALIGRALAALTVDPKRAAADLDAALADPDSAKGDKLWRAQMEDLRARAALNAGDLTSAKTWIKLALDHSGGLTMLTSVMQAQIRGDAAIISRLSGDEESTRRYLAYTGAGHMEDTDWIGHYTGELPVCGTDGIEPQDVAVVEFSINDSGGLNGVAPVYTSRPGSIGAAFAQSVGTWRWNPDELKKVNGFWRSTLRLELRCETRPAPEALDKRFAIDTAQWLKTTGHLTADFPVDDPKSWSAMTTNDALVGWLLPLRFSGGSRQHLSYADVLLALDQAKAPAAAYAMAAAIEVGRASHLKNGPKQTAVSTAPRFGLLVPQLESRFPNDPATAWLMIEWAFALETRGSFGEARPVLQRVLAFPQSGLPAGDPLRRVALLHAGIVATKLGDPASARNAAAEAGVTAAQCTLFETKPVPQNTSIASEQFPADAQRWRFEGHVEEAFDIAADGGVANVRTVLAYPPFVFGPGTEQAVRRFRYMPPTLGGQAVGCSGQTVGVNYRLSGG